MAFSRGRSLTEVLIAVICVCFLLGFVAVLCIGNYYRAKRAMERQRQRRLARLSGQSGVIGFASDNNSPRSIISGSSSSEEQRNLVFGGMYPTPTGTQRRKYADETPDLLLHPNKPNIQAV
jgi:type II secretory pathway pseudopilin PulG